MGADLNAQTEEGDAASWASVPVYALAGGVGGAVERFAGGRSFSQRLRVESPRGTRSASSIQVRARARAAMAPA